MRMLKLLDGGFKVDDCDFEMYPKSGKLTSILNDKLTARPALDLMVEFMERT